MKEKTKRNKLVKYWCRQGFSYRYVGSLFGISKQRAHQIDHKKRKFWDKVFDWLCYWFVYKNY